MLQAIFALLFIYNFALAEEERPVVEAVKKPELLLRAGNESNPVDGIFGPFTYGLRGSYPLKSGFNIEVAYTRLHEPKTSALKSQLDETQATLILPPAASFSLAATAWKNRMVDMYTNLLGLEVTQSGVLAFTVGVYAGTATREDVRRDFRGAQLSVMKAFGSFEIGAGCLLGRIDRGAYRKAAVEAAVEFGEIAGHPLTLTLSVEDRYFDFGSQGPVSESRDEFIFISGLEIHFI